jgi:hypothetical protein
MFMNEVSERKNEGVGGLDRIYYLTKIPNFFFHNYFSVWAKVEWGKEYEVEYNL